LLFWVFDVVVDDGIVGCGQLSDGSFLHYVWIWIDERSKDIFVNGGDECVVSVVASDVEGVLSIEHLN